jgi:type VI secretion system secreted protein VgrG
MLGLADMPRDEARLLRLHAASLPPGLALVPVRATLHEALNQGFKAVVDVLAPPLPTGASALLGQPLTLQLKLADGRYRAWQGLVAAAACTGAVGRLARWRLVLRPWLSALALRQDSRVYQRRDALAIVADVFGAHPGARWRVDGAPRPAERALCVQYRESDFAFAARLLASEGLHWRIAHEPDGQGGTRHELVISDAAHLGADLGALPFAAQHPTAFLPGREDPVTDFMAARRAASNAVALGCWDARQLAGTAVALRADDAPGALPGLQRYDGAGRMLRGERAGPAEAARAAAQALQALALRGERFDGVGGVRRLEAGQRFALPDHPVHGAGGGAPVEGFTVLAVEHRAANNLGADAARALGLPRVEGGGYRNRFQAVAAGTALVPPALRPPAAPAALGACVVGLRGAVLASDRDHRVKVQFHFQRGRAPNPGGLPHGTRASAACHAPGDERCGAALRVLGPAAGAGWGTVAVPRVGAEVGVVFEHGDIDRPLVAGGLYHGGDAAPFAAGEGSGMNHGGALSGLHTRAVDGAGFNQWVLDDSRGQLRMRLHASAAQSEFGLGHLIQQGAQGAWRGAWRGAGFEGHTQGWAGVRAGAGLLLSTQARPGRYGSAQGAQMDATEGLLQLRAALELAQRLGAAARAVRAPGLDTCADGQALARLIAALDPARQGRHPERVNGQAALQPGGDGRTPGTQPVPALGEPLALLDSASAALLASGAAVHAHAGEGVSVVAQGDVQLSAAAGVSAACGGTAGVYAHQGGVAARAAHGPVTLRAHADGLRVLADQTLTVLSTGDEIHIAAQRRVCLVGGDSALTLDGADITLATPGTVTVRGVVHEFLGAQTALTSLPVLPSGIAHMSNVLASGHGKCSEALGVAGIPSSWLPWKII